MRSDDPDPESNIQIDATQRRIFTAALGIWQPVLAKADLMAPGAEIVFSPKHSNWKRRAIVRVLIEKILSGQRLDIDELSRFTFILKLIQTNIGRDGDTEQTDAIRRNRRNQINHVQKANEIVTLTIVNLELRTNMSADITDEAAA